MTAAPPLISTVDDVGTAYTRLLLGARQQAFAAGRAEIQRMSNALQAARNSLADIAFEQPHSLTGERAAGLRKQMDQILTGLSTELAGNIDVSVHTTVGQVIERHRALVTSAYQAAGVGTVGVAARFDRVNEDVLSVLGGRRGGTARTFRTLVNRHIQDAAPALDLLLEAGIARGQSIPSLAKAVAELLGGTLVSNPALQLPRMGGLTSIMSDAKMIARSETMNALREANRLSMLRSGMVAASKWTLSGNHKEEDICDEMAAADNFGFGPGMYPPGSWPLAQHPNCACCQGKVIMRPVSEWGSTVPATPPQVPVETGAKLPAFGDVPSLERAFLGQAELPTGRGDAVLAAIADDRGFSGLPRLGTSVEVDAAVSSGWQEAFRGVTDVSFADQFRTGPLFAGQPGGSGIGTYLSGTLGETGDAARAYAKFYSTKKGEVMRMALSPDAKTTTMDALKVEQKQVTDAIRGASEAATDKADKDALLRLWFELNDPGRFAAYRGYDAYWGFESSTGYQEIVVLNRTKLMVEQP